MVLREFYYGIDNVTVEIKKEDKTNVDTMTLKTNFGVDGNVGDEIKFYDENSELAFAGYIETKNTTGQIIFYCEDYGSILKRSITNEIYINQLSEDIIEDVVTSVGLTYVSTITTTEQIPTYNAPKKNSQEIVEELADKLLANYSTDVNKNFKLELEGVTASTKAISNDNGIKDGSWEEDMTELINDIYVEGDSRSVFNKEESFNGTGSQTEFTLTEIPIDIRVEHPVGTLKAGYVEGQSTGDYQIIREQKKIVFDTAPSSGTNNVFVNYNFSVPVNIRRRNKVSIDTYGQRSSVIRKNWIITREDARNYAEYAINNFSQPLVNSIWMITSQTDINDWKNFKPNDSIVVSDNLTGFDNTYVIRKVERRYGTGIALKITVGSRERNLALWDKEVADRIRQLEQRDDNSTILNEDEFVEESVTQQFDINVIDVEKRTFASDTFYLEENTVGTRNQMKEDGTGPVMREVGYIPSSVLSNDILVTEDGFTEITTEGGELLTTEGGVLEINTTGVFMSSYKNDAVTNYITTLQGLISHIAVGDDNTIPIESNTALGNETYRDAYFSTSSSSTNLSYTMFMDTTENNGNTINETGLFDASSGGNLYTHSLTNTIDKTNLKEVFIETNISFNTEDTDL